MASEARDHRTGEDDSITMDDSSGSESEPGCTKRARVSAVRGPPRLIPDDVLDAIIKLRVSKESAFVNAADGRARNSRGKVWERISAELLRDFGDRDDVSKTALHPRQLGKRWAYIEKQFKVRCCSIIFTKILTFLSLCSQRYLASRQTSGAGHKEPPSFAKNKDVLEGLLDYYHIDRPDIVPPLTYDSLAGLARASLPAEAPECVLSQPSTISTRTPLRSPPAVERDSGSGRRKATTMSVLGDILEGKHQRHEEEAQLTKTLSAFFSAQQAPTAHKAVTPDMMRTTASLFLARLEDDEDICENVQALSAVQNALRVLHGSRASAAEQMASRVCVLSERAVAPMQAVKRLHVFLQAVGTGGGGD